MSSGNSEAGSQKANAGSSSSNEPTQPGPNQNNGGANPGARDYWDKLEILLRPAAAFLTAITVALIGWYGQQALKTESDAKTDRTKIAEEEITRRNQISQNYRLYTQLLSNREESESGLRKDIFSSILQEFLLPQGADGNQKKIANQLLKLEILALNFGETLSLSPLFIELDKDIRSTTYQTEFAELDKVDDRTRLESLAKRVSQQQLSALSTGGMSWDFEVPLDAVIDEKIFHWPEDNIDYTDYTDSEFSLEDTSRVYTFRFTNADREFHSINVELDIQTKGQLRPIERKFKLNFFNFPMVNNTRLSNDQRFALIMTRFENKAIHFSAICFPGKYSSQRDKPFLDDVIHRLRIENLKLQETSSQDKQ